MQARTIRSPANGRPPAVDAPRHASKKVVHACDDSKRCDDKITRLEADVARFKAQEAKEHVTFRLIEDLLAQDDLYMMMDVFFAYVEGLFPRDQRHRCAVFLLDADTDSMAKIVPKLCSVEAVPTTRSIAAEVASTGATVSARDLSRLAAYNPGVDLAPVAAATFVAFGLLDSTGDVFAVVQALSSAEMAPFDLALLQRLGPILSNAMRKAIEFHDILLSQRTQAALLHIVSSSSTEETILKLVQRVIKGANHIVHCESVTLFLLDWPRNELWSLSSSFRRSNLRFAIDGCLLGAAALSSAIINVKHAPSDARFDAAVDDRGSGATTALYVPIGVHHMNDVQPIAVLECINKLNAHKEPSEFTYEDECAFEAFASEVAVILRRRSQETDYLKLLADTKSESLWAERAQSQVNLLEAFTSKPCSLQSQLADRLSDSFFNSESLSPLPALDTPPRPLTQLFKTKSVDVPTVPRWSLNVFTTELETLLSYTQNMLLDPVMALPNLDPSVVQNFIQIVQDHYHPNPFHNFLHGFSVLHTSYCILKDTQAVTVLTPPDRFGCLIAALCHDIDHPGHSNVFEVNSRSALALLHNDDAVLERHHAATTFRLLQNEHVNILQGLSPDEYRYARKVIVRAIIGTDMAQHFEHIEALEKRWLPYARTADPLVEDRRGPALAGFGKSADDRIFLVQTIVHASDLGAQVFPTPIALKWSNMIAKEFAYQALMETAEGLPVTHLHVDDPLHMVESQHFFAARIVQPLWHCLVRFLPKLDHCLGNLQKNIAHYESEIRRLKQLSPHSPRKRLRPLAHSEGQAIPGTTRCTPAKFNSFRLCSGDLKTQLSFSSLISDFSATSLDTADDMGGIDDVDDDD
ncbi:3'5'-cyclic nucleotide phosphodiesterase [Achlya hypogyna]|uniref:Phosphodiesterase n=1 Tax=Achlya hypogyna TaxID=1202772 RepID=A0A1V9Z864_ACHHY|nr:3'5'-cyclic nucleotide phosphodiesterase [Achlya hypogyna]